MIKETAVMIIGVTIIIGINCKIVTALVIMLRLINHATMLTKHN